MKQAMRHEAEVLHQIPGRFRIRLAILKGDSRGLETVAETLRACRDVHSVTSNPVTGSLLIMHSGSFSDIAACAAESVMLELVQRKDAPLDIQRRFNEGLRQLDRDIMSVTGGNIDVNGLLILAFTSLAIQQAIQGQVAIPAATALWYAMEAARSPRNVDKSASPTGE